MKKIPTKLINEEEIALDTDISKSESKPVGSQDPKVVDAPGVTASVKAEGGEKTPDSKEDTATFKAKDAGETDKIAKGPQDAPEKASSETKAAVKAKVAESIKFVIYEGLPRAVISETNEKVEILYDTETGEKKEVKKEECKKSWLPKTARQLKEFKKITLKESLMAMAKDRIVEIKDEVHVLEEEGGKVILEKKDLLYVLKETDNNEEEKEEPEEKDEKDKKELEKKEESYNGKRIYKAKEDVKVSIDKFLEKGDRFIVLSEDEFNKPIDKAEAEMWKDPVEVKMEMPDVPDKIKEELTDKQKQLDVDGDGKIEGEDLAKLRADKKEEDSVEDEKNKKYGLSGITKSAWDACCDGEWLAKNYSLKFDPWDGNHDSVAREIEKDAQTTVEEAAEDSEDKKDEAIDGDVNPETDVPYRTNGEKVEEKVYKFSEDTLINGTTYKAGTKFTLVK